MAVEQCARIYALIFSLNKQNYFSASVNCTQKLIIIIALRVHSRTIYVPTYIILFARGGVFCCLPLNLLWNLVFKTHCLYIAQQTLITIVFHLILWESVQQSVPWLKADGVEATTLPLVPFKGSMNRWIVYFFFILVHFFYW